MVRQPNKSSRKTPGDKAINGENPKPVAMPRKGLVTRNESILVSKKYTNEMTK
jgi:hypothetical protein